MPAPSMNLSHGHQHDFASAPRTELALGSTYDWRAGLSLDDASADLLLEEILLKMFIFLQTNFGKNLDHKKMLTKLHKIDSNYSYKCLEAISSIQTTWNSKNSTCKLIFSSTKSS